MKISILSPESAAGRTFISLGLFWSAYSQNHRAVQLLGYDIEKPDLLQYFPDIKFDAQEVYASFPKIDKNHCMFCGACVHFCRTGALKLDRSIPAVITDPDKCEACSECIDGCNIRGITLKERLTGYLLQGKMQGHAITIGQAEDAHDFILPLICTLNQFRIPESVAICDHGPGFSGKVSLALKDADLAIVIIKPSNDEFSALETLLTELDKKGVRRAILLNQVESLNGEVEMIKEYAFRLNIPLLGILPVFKSKRLKNITDFNSADSGMAAIFAAVWDKVTSCFPENSNSL
jgi:MinD superfamily P-loop ATPase